MSQLTRQERRMKVIFEVRLNLEYSQRLSNIEGIHVIMAEHADTPERKREARKWLEKGIAALDEWYQSRLNE